MPLILPKQLNEEATETPHKMDRGGSVTAVIIEEEVLFSGNETASDGQGLSGGCLSGSGEWQANKSATDSDRLEHVGSRPQPDNVSAAFETS